MARGGSRPGAGRPPDTGSLREAARIEAGLTRALPKERRGEVPEWPLSRATQRELAVWAKIWTKPQAVIWEEQAMHDEVAVYVRTFVEAEQRNVPAARRTLLLQQQNSLMLTHASLLRAGYRISVLAPVPVPKHDEPAAEAEAAAAVRPSSRGRLRAVTDVGPGT